MPASRDEDNVPKRKKPGRAPTACCECRRLKFKCDKQAPCSRCVSRGCAAICPDGTLARKGSRLILSSTTHLEARIDALTARVRELEEALRTLQENHPLLNSGFLPMKLSPNSVPIEPVDHPANQESPTSFTEFSGSPSDSNESRNHKQTSESSGQANGSTQENQTADQELSEAFGTLSLGSAGQSAFFGRTARPEFMLFALSESTNEGNNKHEAAAEISTQLSSLVIHLTPTENDFPECLELRQEVFSKLPPLSEAARLCDCYLKGGEWLYFAPIKRTEIYDRIIANVYTHDLKQRERCPHAVALLFIILALGSLYDDMNPTDPGLSRDYFYCARAALSFASPYRYATVESVQTLSHMSLFLFLYYSLYGYERATDTPAWAYIGLAIQLATSIGLHLNNERWNLPSAEVERRSRVFWSIFCLDIQMSFSTGRPPNISPVFMDCPIPPHLEVVLPDGRREPNFHAWSFDWNKFLYEVMTRAFGTKVPTYSEIVELDRRIRDFRVPEHLVAQCKEPNNGNSILLMQWYWVLAMKEGTILNLHRSHFALALREMPDDPLKHQCAASVLAAYRSSWRLIEALKIGWDHSARPHLAMISGPWSLALASCIALGLLVVRSSGTGLARTALETLDTAESLFKSAAPTCRAAANYLSWICGIRKKSYAAALSLTTGPNPSLLHHLESLGGKTQLLCPAKCEPAKCEPERPPPHNKPAQASPIHPPTSSSAAWDAGPLPMIIDDGGLSDMFVQSQAANHPYGYERDNSSLGIDFSANPDALHRRIMEDMNQIMNTTDHLLNFQPSGLAEALQDTDWSDSSRLEGFVFDYGALNMEYFQNEGFIPTEARTIPTHLMK